MFLILFSVCLVATAVAAPRQMRALHAAGVSSPGASFILPTVLVSGIAVGVGTVLAPEVGLHAPFFEAVVGGTSVVPPLAGQLPMGVLLGAIATAGVLALYYGLFRPQLDPADVLRMERARLQIGMVARVLQGGIVEEIIFRWGALALFAWLGSALGGGPTLGMWFGIIMAGLVFGLAHLPGAAALGMRRSGALVGTAVVVNLWVGVVCGWLAWHYGLLAAMLAHGLVHVLWWPFDHMLFRRLEARNQAA
jgi:hypothetical protein